MHLPFSLDIAARTINYNNKPIKLTEFEAAVIKGLLMAPRHQLESWQLLEIAGNLGKNIEKPALEVLLTRLRKKLIAAGGACNVIAALRNWGYKLNV